MQAFVVVGDSNGHVGLGVKCAKEVATAIRGVAPRFPAHSCCHPSHIIIAPTSQIKTQAWGMPHALLRSCHPFLLVFITDAVHCCSRTHMRHTLCAQLQPTAHAAEVVKALSAQSLVQQSIATVACSSVGQ